MTRRQRAEARLEKRKEWAESRAKKSDQAATAAKRISDGIPLGQPILIGHHSEKRHRRDIEKIGNGWRRAVEHDNMAKHHREKASGIEAQLEGSIYSDDPDAIEAIEARIAENEAKRDRMKAVNAAYRKRDAVKLAEFGLDIATLDAQIEKLHSWDRQPFASFTLTNLGARIRSEKKRIETIKAQKVLTKAAENRGGVLIRKHGEGYCSVTFADFPGREMIKTLKGNGFWWSGGNKSWNGRTENLPEQLRQEEPA
jgi:hypothetical protein